MSNPNLVIPDGPDDESLMSKIIKAAPNTPGNVETASNPNSILNRLSGDLTTHPISKQFTRQPRNPKVK